MNRIFFLAAAALAGPASANVVLYGAGRVVRDQGIDLRAYGSGTIAETDETALEGTTSVRVTTRNFFQGGIMRFARPVDLAGSFGDRNNLLMMSLRVAEQNMMFGGPGGMMPGGPGGMMPGGPGGMMPGGPGGMMPGGPGGMMPGGPPPGMIPGGRAGGGPGGMDFGGFGGGAAGAPAALRQIRLVVTTTDGLRSEAFVPIAGIQPGPTGWRRVGLPLQAISGFERTNRVVRSIAFSGDTTSTFFVGEMVILNDATPLFVEPNVRELNLAIGDEVELFGVGTGGASLLEYRWDFDASDGVQIDATGQVVRRRFRKAGEYTITLTVADAFGLKAPFSTTIRAIINP